MGFRVWGFGVWGLFAFRGFVLLGFLGLGLWVSRVEVYRASSVVGSGLQVSEQFASGAQCQVDPASCPGNLQGFTMARLPSNLGLKRVPFFA